ncbi:thermonuclease family protein, partial [Phaeobacter sp. B1627]|uniref:thermonuclease family protein n=1 Tax=Phaeobacter sp. B1627 TaxID=2583809 RepID=UPI00111A34CD
MSRIVLAWICLCSAVSAGSVPDCGLYAYRVEIVRVIDGDTVVADIDLGFDVWLCNEHLRLFAIQSEERNEKGFLPAKIALEQRLTGQDVYICTVKSARSDNEKTGSFGRYLATVYVNGENV